MQRRRQEEGNEKEGGNEKERESLAGRSDKGKPQAHGPSAFRVTGSMKAEGPA